MWNEIMNSIYQDVGCEIMRIISPESAGDMRVLENIMLYSSDILMELYYEYLIDDKEYEIDFADDEWKRYEPLICDDDIKGTYSFAGKVGKLKSTRKKVILLDYIKVDQCKIDENTISFPDSIMIPFFILYLQNKSFFSLFSSGDKRGLKYGKDILKFANILTSYDDENIYGYIYEKLTGVNLALLFANYYIDIVECLGLKCYDDSPEGVVDEDWEQRGEIYIMKIKVEMLQLLNKIMGLSMIFGRILWADIILQTIYIGEKIAIVGSCLEPLEEENMNNDFKQRNFKLRFKKNRDIVEEVIIKYFSLFNDIIDGRNTNEVIDLLNRAFESRKENKKDRIVFSNERFDIFKNEVDKRISDKRIIRHIWNTKKDEEDIKKIISEKDSFMTVGYSDIGKYIKKDIRKDLYKKLPIIFMEDDIVKKEKYAQEVNEFLTYALKLNNLAREKKEKELG